MLLVWRFYIKLIKIITTCVKNLRRSIELTNSTGTTHFHILDMGTSTENPHKSVLPTTAKPSVMSLLYLGSQCISLLTVENNLCAQSEYIIISKVRSSSYVLVSGPFTTPELWLGVPGRYSSVAPRLHTSLPKWLCLFTHLHFLAVLQRPLKRSDDGELDRVNNTFFQTHKATRDVRKVC